METFRDITASCAREGTELDSDLTADISAQVQMLVLMHVFSTQ